MPPPYGHAGPVRRGPHQGEGKLIASAFTSRYESKNGLVTVYDKDGELLANANY
ncbi:hypothetical protein ACIGPN_25815 [Streptomyces afghaniensis]|uniref:hypothetical protein n=1 Tax=Streptomyces TaxID=1883 RepID=UPI001FAFB387|nr:hypothetical protein [Streptomyces sp. HP-A2021]UOB15909.1 hypothetical protein MQE23_31065 [Streptomyces sp. HP-A2021]